MTPKPQSVCKWCSAPIVKSNKSWADNGCAIVCRNQNFPFHEPVAEPAEPSASPRQHQWKGYENSAGYGTICTECHVTVPYPSRLPTTPCTPAAPQPVAGHLEIMADAAKEAVRMGAAAADKYMRYAQPVAGEGPRFYPGHVVGCMSTFSKPGVNCKCEGTPKLEEATQLCVELALRKFDEWMEEDGPSLPTLDIRTSDFAAILRPFITPACTPPNVIEAAQECLKFMDRKPDVFGLAIIDNGTNNRMEELRKAVEKFKKVMQDGEMKMICGNRAEDMKNANYGNGSAGETFFCEGCQNDRPIGEEYTRCEDSNVCNKCAEKQIAELATPASTGEANGWDAKVKDLLGEMQMFKDKQGFWLRAEQLLETAPTSVPQVEPPK